MITARAFYRFILLSALVLFSAAAVVRAQEESGDIQKMMSPEEFKGAGLNKLSAEELQKLNEWLHGFRQETVQATEKKAAKEGRHKFDVVVSRVVGPFYGLTGATIIRLEDGSRLETGDPERSHRRALVRKTSAWRFITRACSVTRCASRARAISTSTRSGRRSSGTR